MADEESEIVNDMFIRCRLCIIENGQFAIIPSTQIHSSIYEIYGVKIEPYDGLSQLLCLCCKDKLIENINLRAGYITNQEILAALKKNHLQEGKSSQCDHKEQVKQEPEDIIPKVASKDTETPDLLPYFTSTPIIETKPPVSSGASHSVNRSPILQESQINSLSGIEDQAKEQTKVKKDEINIEKSDQYYYQYYCRMCNSVFESACELKEHVKSHSNIIKLQRKYTPYTCSVRLTRIMHTEHSSHNDNDNPEQVHSLFYKKRKLAQECEIEFLSEENDPDVSMESCEDEANYTCDDAEDYMETQISQNESVNVNNQEICGDIPNQITGNLDNSSSIYELNTSVSNSNHFAEDLNTDFEITPSIDFDIIINTIQKTIDTFIENEEEEMLKKTLEVLIHLCQNRLKIVWHNDVADTRIELNNISCPKRSSIFEKLNGFIALPSSTDITQSADITLTNDNDSLSNENSCNGSTGKFKIKVTKTVTTISNSQSNEGKPIIDTAVNLDNNTSITQSLLSFVNLKHDTSNAPCPLPVKKSENWTESLQSDLNSENNPRNNQGLLLIVNSENDTRNTNINLPVVVNTSALDPTAIISESTSVYLDLEDENHTITSTESLDLASPVAFFKYILEKEKINLYLASHPPSAVSLACYKKNIECKSFIISIGIENNNIFIEVCQIDGCSTHIELCKEDVIIQWLVLSSLCEPKISVLMKNYAKKFSLDVNIVDRFIKVIRSISGKIEQSRVTMAAPRMLFF